MGTLTQSFIKSYESSCFQEHFKEFIAHNSASKQFYGKLTNGKSDRIFNRLIASEYLLLGPAALLDLRALPFHKNGLGLFCHELMSLDHEIRFDKKDIKPLEIKPQAFNWEFFKKQILKAAKEKDEKKLRLVTVTGLRELKAQPDYYHFTRHLFESVYRFAYFIPVRSAEAEQLDLKDPADLMFDVIKLHARGLGDCHRLDLWCQPIQESGIPILRSELPTLLSDLEHPELEVLRN